MSWKTDFLLTWYDQHKRKLPWRDRNDAYGIWVSEIMLQQTRVDTVIPYYLRWMERFPTLNVLAHAQETEVVRYWEGLGYYSRARNLRRGAGEVLERFGGQIPDNLTQLRSIAGIGEYTAGAILSIAFHARVPAVDGNVLRIISRLENIGDDIAKPAVKRQITALVADKVPHDRPGDFNQALMDLGASICIPRTPLCSQCPLSGDCRAYALGTERTLPLKAPKNKPEPVYVAAGVLRDATGRFLLRQRPQQGLLAGMWEFPGIERPDRHAHIQELQEFFTPAAESLVITENNRLDMTHTFSHRRWFIRFYFIEGDFSKIAVPDSKWIEPAACDQLPFAGPHRQAALHYCTNIG